MFSINVPQSTLIPWLFIQLSPHLNVFHIACSVGWCLAVLCLLVLALYCTPLLPHSLPKHTTIAQKSHLLRWRRERGRLRLHPQGYSPRLKSTSSAILRPLILKMQPLIGAVGWRGGRERGRGEGGWVRKCEIVAEGEVVVCMVVNCVWYVMVK